MHPSLVTRIDHVGIAVPDLDEGVERYQRMFDITVLGRETNGSQGVEEVMLRVTGEPGGLSCVQLLRPLRDDSPVGRFLASRGGGIHHIAYGVEDITAALARLREQGTRLIDDVPRHGFAGSAIAFIHPTAMSGVLTELVQAAAP